MRGCAKSSLTVDGCPEERGTVQGRVAFRVNPVDVKGGMSFQEGVNGRGGTGIRQVREVRFHERGGRKEGEEIFAFVLLPEFPFDMLHFFYIY